MYLFVSAHATAVAHQSAEGVIMVHLLDVAVAFIHTCVAAVEEDGGKPVVVVDEIGTVMVVCICSHVYLYTMFLNFST